MKAILQEKKVKRKPHNPSNSQLPTMTSNLTGSVHLSPFDYKTFKVFHLGPNPNFNLTGSVPRLDFLLRFTCKKCSVGLRVLDTRDPGVSPSTKVSPPLNFVCTTRVLLFLRVKISRAPARDSVY